MAHCCIQQRNRAPTLLDLKAIDPDAKTFKLASRDFTTTTELEAMLEEHLRELLVKRLNLAEGEAVQGGIR